jgi:peptide-methionine (S)-S-oxide reductase
MSAHRKPQPGDVVTVHFNLNTDSNLLFDYNSTVSFVLFGGNYLPDLHQVVSTLSPGESAMDVLLDAGYGDRNSDLIITISNKEASEKYGLDVGKIQVGTALLLSNGATCPVVAKTRDDFTLDANPPLAGVQYRTTVTLQRVDDGPTADQFLYSPTHVNPPSSSYQVMTIALGCFWGGELHYMRIPGVVGTSVGYTQGHIPQPSYKMVCSGTTGHTEAIQVVYDPSIVSLETLVRTGMNRLGKSMFLLNQVGNDRGTQYRHGVYYHNEEQKNIALGVIQSFGDACVTECKPATVFYKAEDYHQQYLLKGGQSAKKNEEETIRCYG